jgi:NAD-reducing hydrogenase large subunit
MNLAVERVARDYLSGTEITEGLLNRIEVAIRAYDPCLSCATHAMGEMPLIVEVLDCEGRLVDRKVRGGPGDGE